MTFELEGIEAQMLEATQQVCREVLEPNAARYDADEEFCADSLSALGELGCLGLNIPEEYGGPGISSWAMTQMVQAVAAACASTASAMTAHFLATDSILLGGTEEQKQRLLPLAASGKALGAFALTEPAAGSNPADIRTKAMRDGDGWRVRGTKHYITNAREADFIVLYAKTDADAGHHGISAFIVEKGTPGVTFANPEKTLGLRGSYIYELAIDTVLGADTLLGAEGGGFATAMEVLDRGRVEVAAMSLGISDAALTAAIQWAKDRQIGAKQLAGYQGTQWRIADMYTQFQAARMVTYQAAVSRDSGKRFSTESAVAKLHASECAGSITDAALQLHGGYGYIRDLPLERYARDARIMRIFEGTTEIQKVIISRALLK